MSDIEKKAQTLLSEAIKKKSPHGVLSIFFRTATRMEEASDLFVKAANTFKMCKKWTDAGNAFVEAAHLQIHCDSKHNAAMYYVEAGNCFRKENCKEAVSSYTKAIDIYIDMGRFIIAAKQHVSIAEIYEQDNTKAELVISHYERASDYFKGEESNSSANKCLAKVANIAAKLGDYSKSINIYEQIGASCLQNSLLKYCAKDYYFKASICHLCTDYLNAEIALHKYEELCPSFNVSREYKLVKDLVDTMEERDSDAFAEVIRQYDSISRLDEWQTALLLRAKKSIDSVPDLR